MAILNKLIWLLAASVLPMGMAQEEDNSCDPDPTSVTASTSASVVSTSSESSTSSPTTLTTITSLTPPTATPITTTSTTSVSAPSPSMPITNTSVTSVSFSGNGCGRSIADGKYGNYTGDFGPGGLDFTYHNFTAVLGQGVDYSYSPTQKTSNCQAHIQGQGAPEGFQFSPDLIRYKGFAVLDPGTTVTFYITTYFSQNAAATYTSQQSTTNSGTERVAKFVDGYTRQEVWSPCIGSSGAVGILNMNFRVSITSSNSTAALAYFGPLEVMGRAAVEVEQNVRFKWQACKA